jgi:hypothetical protein
MIPIDENPQVELNDSLNIIQLAEGDVQNPQGTTNPSWDRPQNSAQTHP